MQQSFFLDPSTALGLMGTGAAADSQLINVGAGKNNPAEDSEFQKLLDQKVQTAKPESQPNETPKEAPKAEQNTEAKAEEAPAEGEEGEAVVLPEDAQSMAKRLMQAGLIPVDPAAAAQIQPVAVLEAEPEAEALPVGAVSENSGEAASLLTVEGQEAEAIPVQAVQEGTADQPEWTAGQERPVLTETPQTQPEAAPQAEEATQNVTEASPEPSVERTAQQTEAPKESAAAGQSEEPEHETAEVSEAVQMPQTLFQDVKAAPVKVGEAYAPEQSGETPDVGTQVGEQLTQAVEQGASHVEIQLTPDSLGNVTVDITRTQDGMLHVAISAERAETQGLLEKHAVNIQSILGRSQDSVQVEVQRQEGSQENHNQQHSYDGHSGNQQKGGQQQGQRRQTPEQSQDFLHQLRLGLVPSETEES